MVYHEKLIEKALARGHSFVEIVNSKGISLFIKSEPDKQKTLRDICANEAVVRSRIIKIGVVDYEVDDGGVLVYSRLKNEKTRGSLVRQDRSVTDLDCIEDPIICFFDGLESRRNIRH